MDGGTLSFPPANSLNQTCLFMTSVTVFICVCVCVFAVAEPDVASVALTPELTFCPAGCQPVTKRRCFSVGIPALIRVIYVDKHT